MDSEFNFWQNWYPISPLRDVEYDWSTLVENVADPSHVPFAHHGVQGKRESAQPLPIEIVRSPQRLSPLTRFLPSNRPQNPEPPTR